MRIGFVMAEIMVPGPSRYQSRIVLPRAFGSGSTSANLPRPSGLSFMPLADGLRRAEIDNLLWRALNFTGSSLRVVCSDYQMLKAAIFR
jgi:hypothetical protein